MSSYHFNNPNSDNSSNSSNSSNGNNSSNGSNGSNSSSSNNNAYMNNNIPYKILIFSWNTESIPLCETMSDEQAYQNRSPMFSTWKYQSNMPDFFEKLSKKITEHQPDVVVIGFQEDRHPGSYFHSHLLINEMPTIGYKLVKRTKLMGVGVTTYKGLKHLDFVRRGIRVSIYAKNEIHPLIEREEVELRSAIPYLGQKEYICSSNLLRNKGATVSYLILPHVGRIAFICCHLPFNAHSLIQERLSNNKMLRQNELNHSNTCFNNIIEELVLSSPPIPNYVFYFGDFNYRLDDPRPASDVASMFLQNPSDHQFLSNMYNMYDELKEQMKKENIYSFCEGVNNGGPMFLPTCKMRKGRVSNFGVMNTIDEVGTSSIVESSTIYPVNNNMDCESVPHIPPYTNDINHNEHDDRTHTFRSRIDTNRYMVDASMINRNNNQYLSPMDEALATTRIIYGAPTSSRHHAIETGLYPHIPHVNNAPYIITSDPVHPTNTTSFTTSSNSSTIVMPIADTNCWNTGKYNQRVPSWCDRILYKKYNDDNHRIFCRYYDRFDVGHTMAKSDHAAVIGVFEII